MLPRILEAELMDTPEEALAYDEMDHTEVNRIFIADLLAAAEAVLESRSASASGDDWEEPSVGVLDLGTGTAQQPIELCRQCDAVRVMAADAATSMLDLARYNIEIAGLTQRIQLDHVDAKQLPYSAGMFDITMSNSILHHIPEPIDVLRESVRVTAAGGLLFFRDLARPADEQELDHLVGTYAGEANDVQRRLFRDSLHAALSVDEMQQWVSELGFDASSVRVTSDRHWTWSAQR